jgi:Ca-activated chloride channel homolog
MKRLSIVALSILLLGSLIFSGCASGAAPTAPAFTQPAVPTFTQAPVHTTAAAPRTTMPAPTYSQPQAASPRTNPPAATMAPTTRQPSGGAEAPAYTTAPQTTTAGAPAYPQSANSGAIGLSTGGAKDIQNFRENIRNSYLPLPTDVTYEGLFYDYYFDTGATEPSNKLYSPAYSFAVTRDPVSHQSEYYLSVGLSSGMKESDFQRKKLNLVILLDNSGSMSEHYTQYYYDNYGKKVDAYAEEGLNRLNKMSSAEECLTALLKQLRSDDRLAIVTFNSSAHLEKPMGLVGRADMRDIANHVLDITAGGSTNLDAGMDMATRQFNNLYEMDSYEYENRIMVLTDAQPNTGDVSAPGLAGALKSNSANRIYTTFIGIGVDFNTQLIEDISSTKGANYYSVHSPREFKARVEEQFDYMVTPLIFDLQLRFESQSWRIDKVFGSPEADASTGSLMKINTLFASKSDESGAVKGGLVLLKLKKVYSSSEDKVYLRTSYEDRDGRGDGDVQTVYLEAQQPEYFPNSGIRKGVLLSRYTALLKNWMMDERSHVRYAQPWQPCVREDTGILIPDEYAGQWERQSLPLTVSSSYQGLFKSFGRYFTGEMDAIGDDSLGQELDILNMLSRY